MLDMILNQKEKEAEKQKTQMQISTEVFTTLPFSDREIISLFGNLWTMRWKHVSRSKKENAGYI